MNRKQIPSFFMKLSHLLFLFFTTFLYSQKNYIEGVVYVSDIPQANIIFKNVKTGVSNSTNDNGEFQIELLSNDKFIFSRFDLEDYILDVSNITIAGKVKIAMVKKAIMLEEVVINDHSNINAVSLGIVSKNQKTYTPAQRKLYTAGDFKPIHLLGLLGGSFQLDPLLNKINGRTKQLKKNIEIERKEMNIEFLRKKYSDFFRKDLKLTEEEIESFLYYLVETSGINEKIESKNDQELKFFICDVFVRYKKPNETGLKPKE